jgi:hypothetical protein
MSQWTVLLLHPEPRVEYFLQGTALHCCLPIREAARGGADWRVLLCLDINQILTRQNPLRPLPVGEPGRRRLPHQADHSLLENCLGREVP